MPKKNPIKRLKGMLPVSGFPVARMLSINTMRKARMGQHKTITYAGGKFSRKKRSGLLINTQTKTEWNTAGVRRSHAKQKNFKVSFGGVKYDETTEKQYDSKGNLDKTLFDGGSTLVRKKETRTHGKRKNSEE